MGKAIHAFSMLGPEEKMLCCSDLFLAAWGTCTVMLCLANVYSLSLITRTCSVNSCRFLKMPPILCIICANTFSYSQHNPIEASASEMHLAEPVFSQGCYAAHWCPLMRIHHSQSQQGSSKAFSSCRYPLRHTHLFSSQEKQLLLGVGFHPFSPYFSSSSLLKNFVVLFVHALRYSSCFTLDTLSYFILICAYSSVIPEMISSLLALIYMPAVTNIRLSVGNWGGWNW